MKKKLIPIKELRPLYAAQKILIGKYELRINQLQNEVESLEGARQNLRMMYDTHEMEKNRAIQEKIDALASLRESQRQTDRACDVAEKFRDEVRKYENEKAVAMWVRSMKLVVSPVRKAISNFFERVKFRRKRK